MAYGNGWLDKLFGVPTLEVEWTYETGLFDESAAEICAYDSKTKRIFVTNGNDFSDQTLRCVHRRMIA